MIILLAYDIDTKTSQGRRRLYNTAHLCEAVGTRVQHSLFEMFLDPAQLDDLKKHLLSCIDPNTDSIRIYHINSHSRNRTETLGRTRLSPYDELLTV